MDGRTNELAVDAEETETVKDLLGKPLVTALIDERPFWLALAHHDVKTLYNLLDVGTSLRSPVGVGAQTMAIDRVGGARDEIEMAP